MSIIRILGIAPYEGMQVLMEKVAAAYPDIELTVMSGDLDKGVEVAQDNFHSDYDIIISRGGTAQMIRSKVALPVVEIPITEFDILRALHLAENVSKSFAIVGYPNITHNARNIAELMQVEPKLFTIHEQSEVDDLVGKAWDDGYRTVLCDVVATASAKNRGMNAILITSGHESISKAFDDAILLYNGMHNLESENHFLRNVISEQSNETVVFNKEGHVYFSSLDSENRTAIIDMLRNEIPECDIDESRRLVKSLDGMAYTINTKKITSDTGTFYTFYFYRSKNPYSSSKSGIHYMNRSEANASYYNSFHSSAGDIFGLEDSMRLYGQSSHPIMLLGENGTGKESIATILYSRSSLRNHPFVSISSSLLGDKSLDFLLSNHNSPFASSEQTIYISQIESLSYDRQTQLLAALIDMDVCKRNKLILSCTYNRDGSIPECAGIYADKLSCLSLHITPLRHCKDKIPALINLFLNQLDMTQASGVLGMEEEAVKLMSDYSWPRNTSQFKRVMDELASGASMNVITTDEVRHILSLEDRSPITKGQFSSPLRLDLTKTLSEMERELALLVLAECDGNQSAAAKRLGISRTTLWRYTRDGGR